MLVCSIKAANANLRYKSQPGEDIFGLHGTDRGLISIIVKRVINQLKD